MIPKRLRDAVLDRDDHRCVRCGRHLHGLTYSIHHRTPGGMGGSKHVNTMPNLISLCGSGTTGCHGQVESYRERARDGGFLVRRRHDPAARPVRTWRGWELPTDTGWSPTSPPDTTETNEDAA